MLTGGPCAGKTTSINRIKNFFENIGWKVKKIIFKYKNKNLLIT